MAQTTGLLAAIASLASVIGVALVGWQVHSSKAEQLMTFFAEYNDRYDKAISKIPLSILIGNNPCTLDSFTDENERKIIERAIFDYFQLCEEQLNIFAKDKSLSGLSHRKTWKSVRDEWTMGIQQNLRLDLFADCLRIFDERFSRLSEELGSPNFTQFHELKLCISQTQLNRDSGSRE
ncbi:MAG: hypothetical protein EB010_10895 [Acidimicrobiia bacterium]|nr:hypothetical protein [Acidimicrobiia bacterium]